MCGLTVFVFSYSINHYCFLGTASLATTSQGCSSANTMGDKVECKLVTDSILYVVANLARHPFKQIRALFCSRQPPTKSVSEMDSISCQLVLTAA